MGCSAAAYGHMMGMMGHVARRVEGVVEGDRCGIRVIAGA